jgi:hypothetical protein
MDSESRTGPGRAGGAPRDVAPDGLWRDQEIGTPRLPDPVRASAVRAGLAVSFTLVEALVALLGTLAGTWIAAPAMLLTIVSTVVATWAVVDVWVTRQVWNQRNGVVSGPSSVARALRRERRRERRAARRSGEPRRHLVSRA